jgi:hypothetical protein
VPPGDRAPLVRDTHAGPVSEAAWAADAVARTKGRVRNSCTFTKVDLEARCEVERVPGTSPQRIMRWRPDPHGSGQ